MSCFCWLTGIESMVLITSLSQILTFHYCYGISVALRDTNQFNQVYNKSGLVWPSIQLSSLIPREIRNKRDETEDPGRAYGRELNFDFRRKGVGFFVGEPCVSTCNQILFHVSCNLTTHLCECLPDYPVNVDNKICLKAIQIGDKCEYREECSFYDTNAECSSDGICQCSDGYSGKSEDKMGKLCVAGESPMHLRIGTVTYEFISNADLTTLISLISSLFVLIFLFCFVIKLFNKARFNEEDRCYSGGSVPPVILTGLETGPSRDSSNRSVINDFVANSRRASYSLLAPPPSNLASRRPSLSSIRSQSSLRSYSSFRSQSSFRNYRPGIGVRDSFRRTTSSPMESMQQIMSNSSFNAQSIEQNHCTRGLRNKSDHCIIHHQSQGINPSVPHN